MKFRISPAAAAVFLAAGLFTSGLRAASSPAAIPFENDAAFNVTLSNTNPSKVVVPGAFLNRRWRCRCMTTTAGVRAWPWFPWLPARKGG